MSFRLRLWTSMKTLQELKVKLVFPLPGVTRDSAEPLLQLLEQFSLADAAIPWCVQRTYTVGNRSWGQWEAIDDPIEAVRKILSGDSRSGSVGREWRDADSNIIREGIGFGIDNDFGYLRSSTSVLVDPMQQEIFFLKLCELLRPRHGAYLPNYYDAVGSQDMILEMALERDYGMYGDRPEFAQVILAKSIAPLLPRMPFAIPDPLGQPSRLGWLNYWHADVPAELGFPDANKDADLLQRSYRTPSGAWLVKLTEDSLDLTRPDHVEALARAYWRFDKIGKRMQPVAKKTKPRVKRSDSNTAGAEGLNTYVVRERDEAGNWWNAAVEPIRASSAEEALRIHLAKTAHGRAPRPGDTLAKLRKAYDGVAFEVGLTTSENIDVVEASSGSDERLE
jgi:hypothetical protein